MASVPCGFHAGRWARSYEASAREILGRGCDLAPTFVAPLAPDAAELEEVAATRAAKAARAELDDLVGDRTMLLRVDRVEPSKNIVRGFAAFDLLLERHAELRSRVVFVARANPSRESLPEYLGYRNEMEQSVARVNERWGTSDWQPIVLETSDDFTRTVAALSRYDALLVNPIKDGLNLVAKEGPILNQRDGVLCLSPDAGAWDELGEAAIETHPYDLDHAAAALHTALTMPAAERSTRAARLRELAIARTPQDWLADQLDAAR
jgi:trehalose 6-phosphate synthase